MNAMSFKENLRTKMKIDRLFNQVKSTLGPADSDRRLDTERMRELLALSPLQRETLRDLELYRTPPGAAEELILVLDNELAFYRTTAADIALRKSPTVKEMLSIRNAIRILSDGDVVVSKKLRSLETVWKMSLGALDLTCTAADLEAMAAEGIDALAASRTEEVIECLTLLAELTEYKVPPKPFDLEGRFIRGQLKSGPTGAGRFGPLVIYDRIGNVLISIERQLDSRDEDDLNWMRQVVGGHEAPSHAGTAVITWLAAEAARILKV
jgi:hypothetical protein